jgi:hypothetical protein
MPVIKYKLSQRELVPNNTEGPEHPHLEFFDKLGAVHVFQKSIRFLSLTILNILYSEGVVFRGRSKVAVGFKVGSSSGVSSPLITTNGGVSLCRRSVVVTNLR